MLKKKELKSENFSFNITLIVYFLYICATQCFLHIFSALFLHNTKTHHINEKVSFRYR